MEMRDLLQRTLGTAYTLERELGGGGMSQVFVAEETALGRKVVVKVLPPDRSGDVDIERFTREIQVSARLYEAKGDRVKAVEHYRKVIDLWTNADPELQGIVEDLKRRVKRLTDIEGAPR